MGREKYPSKSKNGRKKIERFNGLLGIELFSSECFFQAVPQAKSAEIAQYFADLAEGFQNKGFKKVHIFFDRNPTHKNKMQAIFHQLTKHLTVQFQFHLMAAYSPKLNLVEYAIHLIRQKVLHHADSSKTIADFEYAINNLCVNNPVLNKNQIINVLTHIEGLVPVF